VKAKHNQGGQRLFPESEWVSPGRIQGTDATVLRAPIMEEAFRRVCNQHQQKSDVAVLALCTSKRPYSESVEWKAILETTRGHADHIVTSNGGVIPIEFEREYPFMTYDAHGTSEFDTMYIDILSKRLTTFFRLFEYRKVVGFFSPLRRNRKALQRACLAVGVPLVFVPDDTLWEILNLPTKSKVGRRTAIIRSEKSQNHFMHQMSHPSILKALRREVQPNEVTT